MTNLKIIAFCAAMSAALTGCAQTPPASTAAEGIVSAYPDFTKAAESTINGVVSIKSYATPRASRAPESDYSGIDPFFDFFFGTPQRRQQPRQQQQQPREQQLGLGSGVILTSDGYIATNNHVIQGAERLQVTLNDNSTYDATVVGSDEATDLALLKIEAKDLPVIPMGDSDELKVGEWVIAVGNPFGLTSTVTAGIVSAKARGIGSSSRGAMTIDSYIQTDAAVNAGNSGGALVNTKGELVGINAAIYSQTGNYAGYSFAIPSSIVTKIVGDLREFGTVQRAVLGIRFGELTPELAKEKGITGVNDGIYVGEVIERSAAFEAGLKEGDIIVAADNTPVHTSAQFQEHMARLRPGDVVKLAYLRDGKQHVATATLRNPAGTTATSQRGDFTELGCTFAPVSDEDLSRLGLKAAIRVSALTDGKFREAGVPKDFIILEVNGVRISSVEALEKLYETIMAGSDDNKVLFITGLYPTGKKAFFAIDLTN